jgi:hypothetical protein
MTCPAGIRRSGVLMSAPQLRPAFLAVAPTLSAILAACAGILLLASGATPSEPTRFAIWLAVAPGPLIEVSHFVSSILGLVLILLAFGLRSRLDAAWWAALFALAGRSGPGPVQGVELGRDGHPDGHHAGHAAVPRGLPAQGGPVADGDHARLAAVGRRRPDRGGPVRLVDLRPHRIRRPVGDEDHRRPGSGPGHPLVGRRRHRADGDRRLAADRDAGHAARGRRHRSRSSTASAPSWPRPRTPSRPRTWPCWATSASCSRLRARAS